MDLYTGVRELPVRSEVINQFYRDKVLTTSVDERVFDRRFRFPNQNEYILLQSLTSNQAAIARVKGEQLVLINGNDHCVNGVSPRNLRQRMTMDALMDDSIQVVVLFGRAGTGKTLLALAAALHRMESEQYRRFILSRPMSQLGKRQLGILPGEVDEKFGPYLDNYMDNIEHLLNGRYKNVRHLMEQYRMDFKPLQLIQGSSWAGAIAIVDEAQVLDFEEMVMLGTRVGEGSKIIICGDLGQRVEKIAPEKTGMYKLVNDKRFQESPITASIELTKCERGPVAELFAEIFGV